MNSAVFPLFLEPVVAPLSERCVPVVWEFFGFQVDASASIVCISGGPLLDRLGVEIIFPAFCEQENMFVRSSTSVFHALGHDIRLIPNDLLSQNPSTRPQSERAKPGDPH